MKITVFIAKLEKLLAGFQSECFKSPSTALSSWVSPGSVRNLNLKMVLLFFVKLELCPD